MAWRSEILRCGQCDWSGKADLIGMADAIALTPRVVHADRVPNPTQPSTYIYVDPQYPERGPIPDPYELHDGHYVEWLFG